MSLKNVAWIYYSDINVKDSDGNMIELTQCTGFEDGFMLVAYRVRIVVLCFLALHFFNSYLFEQGL